MARHRATALQPALPRRSPVGLGDLQPVDVLDLHSPTRPTPGYTICDGDDGPSALASPCGCCRWNPRGPIYDARRYCDLLARRSRGYCWRGACRGMISAAVTEGVVGAHPGHHRSVAPARWSVGIAPSGLSNLGGPSPRAALSRVAADTAITAVDESSILGEPTGHTKHNIEARAPVERSCRAPALHASQWADIARDGRRHKRVVRDAPATVVQRIVIRPRARGGET